MDVLSSQNGISCCCQFSFMLDYVDVEIGLYCKVADQTVSILTDIKTISRQLWRVVHAFNISTLKILLRKRKEKRAESIRRPEQTVSVIKLYSFPNIHSVSLKLSWFLVKK